MKNKPKEGKIKTNRKHKESFMPFLEPDELVSARNMVFDLKGGVHKLHYSTFKGLVWQLKRANKACLKFDTKLQYQIILPIKEK